LGDGLPDLVLVQQTGPNIEIFDGRQVAALGPGPTDVASIVAASIPLPADWANTGQGEGTLLPDVNGDGYPDFAIGSAINAVPGTVGVYW
jgi:hypothetical protein